MASEAALRAELAAAEGCGAPPSRISGGDRYVGSSGSTEAVGRVLAGEALDGSSGTAATEAINIHAALIKLHELHPGHLGGWYPSSTHRLETALEVLAQRRSHRPYDRTTVGQMFLLTWQARVVADEMNATGHCHLLGRAGRDGWARFNLVKRAWRAFSGRAES